MRCPLTGINRLANGKCLRISGGSSDASVESALMVTTLEKAIHHEDAKTRRKPEMYASVRIWLHQWIRDHIYSAYRISTSILEMYFLLFVPSRLRGQSQCWDDCTLAPDPATI